MTGQPNDAPEYPKTVLGRLGQVHGITLDERHRWMTATFAAELSGVRATNLNRWARSGWLSFRRHDAKERLRYLRAEMEILRGLSVRGRPPSAVDVRAHVLKRVGQRAELAREAKR